MSKILSKSAVFIAALTLLAMPVAANAQALPDDLYIHGGGGAGYVGTVNTDADAGGAAEIDASAAIITVTTLGIIPGDDGDVAVGGTASFVARGLTLNGSTVTVTSGDSVASTFAWIDSERWLEVFGAGEISSAVGFTDLVIWLAVG